MNLRTQCLAAAIPRGHQGCKLYVRYPVASGYVQPACEACPCAVSSASARCQGPSRNTTREEVMKMRPYWLHATSQSHGAFRESASAGCLGESFQCPIWFDRMILWLGRQGKHATTLHRQTQRIKLPCCAPAATSMESPRILSTGWGKQYKNRSYSNWRRWS